MSRTEYNVEERYTGTGALSDYSFDFKIEALSQLLVIELDDTGVETERVRGTDVTYISSVDFDDENGGGTVTLAAALPADYTLILLLANDAPTQPYEFRDKLSFNLKSFEMALDWLAGALQRLTWWTGRTIRLNDAYNNTAVPVDMQLPTTIVADATIIMSDDGTELEFGPTQAYIVDAYTTAHTALDDITNHIADAADAHDASAISFTPAGTIAAIEVQAAIEELDTAVTDHINDATGAHAASAIANTPQGNLAAVNVQTALNELQDDIDTRALDSALTAHIGDTGDAHDASAISYAPTGGSLTSTDVQAAIAEIEAEMAVIVSPGGLVAASIDFTPAGSIVATDVQAALEELDGDITGHLSDGTDAHDASAISSVAAGNLAATNVQTALDELQTDIDTRATSTALSDHIADVAGAHAASAIAYTPAGAVVATDVQAAITELDSDLTDHISDATAAHAASAIAVTPAGNLAADDVQEALEELQTDIDTLNAAPGGGGGGALRWIEDANAPIKTFENGMEVYNFTPALAQCLYLALKVPSGYVAGGPLSLKVLWYCASVANDALINAVCTLIRAGTDEVTSTANQRTTTNAAVTMSAANDNEPQAVTLDVISAIGEVNAVAVSPGDLLLIKLQESSSTVADDIKFIPDACEVSLT